MSRFLALFCLLIAPAAAAQEIIPAPADATTGPDTVFVQELTWTEVAARVRAGTRSVIVPTGGTEQNGPHMVLGKHNFIIREASERIARGPGGTLVAPVVAQEPTSPMATAPADTASSAVKPR